MRILAGVGVVAALVAALALPQVLDVDPKSQDPIEEASPTVKLDEVADLQLDAGEFSRAPSLSSTTSVYRTTIPVEDAAPSEPEEINVTFPTSSTTTTTKPPATTKLVIPPTLPYQGGAAGGGFTILTSCIEVEVPCANNRWVDFDYVGHGLPYLFNDNGSDGAWWLAGDRGAYAFAYGFLQTGEHIHATDSFINEELIGRFTIIVTDNAGAYGKVNDRHMDEGERYYNGRVATGAGEELKACFPLDNCLTPGVDYATVCELPAWGGRVGFFTAAGEVVDIRDFSSASAGRHGQSISQIHSPGKFVLIGFNGSRVSIGWCPAGQDGLGMHIYYDRMNSGRIAVGR